MSPLARARLAGAASRAPWGPRLHALPAWRQKSSVQGWNKNRARGRSDGAAPRRVRARTADDVAPSAPGIFTEDLLRCCEPGAPLRVAVLLSGGVDSSVALALLRAAGHRVKAYYLQIWFQEDFANTWAACPWEADLAEASAVCKQLGVPLEPLPLSKQYWRLVVDRCLDGVRRGRTPNPDVLCNSAIKFGAFAEALASSGESMDRIATGHYARVERRTRLEALAAHSGGSRCLHETSLHLSADLVKDQTYFLAGLSPQQLALCSFPLGALDKPAVRSLAASLRLPNAARRDSQGLCFLGRLPYAEFLARHLGWREGPVCEWGSGRELGRHRGAWTFTRGQRRGLGLAGGPWYVVQTDVKRNAVWVSNDYYGPTAAEGRREFACSQLAWLRTGPDANLPLSCKVRHGAQMYQCRLEHAAPGQARVELGGSDQGLSPGQYVVFYQGDECLGCGVIEE